MSSLVVPFSKLLDHPSNSLRATAAKFLSRNADASAAEALSAATGDTQVGVRVDVAKALERIASVDVLPALARASTDDSPAVAEIAVKALAKIRDPGSVRALEAALNHPEEKVRVASVMSLGRIGTVASRAVLLAALEHRYEDVRRSAPHAVAADDPDVVRALAEVLRKDNALRVRSAAASALGKVPSAQAAKALAQGAKETTDESLLATITRALLQHDDAAVVEPLCRALGTLQAGASNSSPRRMREDLVRHLGGLRDPRAVPALAAEMNSKSSCRILAVRALAKIRHASAAHALAATLRKSIGTDASMTRETVDALGHVGDPSAVEILTTLIDHNETKLAYRAIEGLGQIGDPAAVEPLLTLLKVGARGNHNMVYWALGVLGDKRALEPLLRAAGRRANPYLYYAATALGRLGDPAATETLLAMLKSSQPADRAAAIRALAAIGEPAAVDRALAMLKHKSTYILQAAAHALGDLGDKRAIEPLVAFAKARYSSAPGLEAICALEKLGYPGAYTLYLSRLRSMDRAAERSARLPEGSSFARVFQESGKRTILDGLFAMAESPLSNARAEAARGLGAYGDRRAIDVLQKLSHAESRRSYDVKSALSRMGVVARP